MRRETLALLGLGREGGYVFAPAHDVLAEMGRHMWHGSGALVATGLVVEDLSGGDGPYTRVSLIPTALASDTLYVIDALRGVEDLAGRTLILSHRRAGFPCRVPDRPSLRRRRLRYRGALSARTGYGHHRSGPRLHLPGAPAR